MEIIDIYDECGQKSGITEDRNIAHKKAHLHKSISVWIMNSKNEVLLQKRSSQVLFPNLFDSSFSGHILAGESSIEAVKREGKEELGFDINNEKLKYLFTCRENAVLEGYCENEIVDVFLYIDSIPLEQYCFTDNEVSEVFYVDFDEFRTLVLEKSHLLFPSKEQYFFLLTALDRKIYKR